MSTYHNLYNLKGKVAVVVGTGGLLGSRHCEVLAACGANVVALDLSYESATQSVENLDGQHKAYQCDITDEEQVVDVVQKLQSVFGVPHILVNNAAINDSVENKLHTALIGFEDYPVDDFRRVLEVNVLGAFTLCKHIGSAMSEQRRGSIVNIASTYGIVAPNQNMYIDGDGERSQFKNVAYPTSKAAVIMLTKYLASYWGHCGVRTNALSPGGVHNHQPEYFVQNYQERTPAGRMAQPTDFAGALVYLASDSSQYMNGHNLVVDGGFTIW